MKKTSILLIALSLFAMIFSGCSMLVPDKTTATIEDFQGNWKWSSTNENFTAQTKNLNFVIEDTSVKMIEDDYTETVFSASVDSTTGILTATNKHFGTLQMSIKETKTMITVTGSKLLELTGEQIIYLNKIFDTTTLPFKPSTTATFDNYKGTWITKGGDKTVMLTFGTQAVLDKEIQYVFASGLSDEFNTNNFVIVTKGVATSTINNEVYFMYMNEEKTGITMTGPKIKAQTGSLYLNFVKY